MIDEILDDAKERMGKTLEALRGAFGKIRTGRANPALLDGISIDYYGAPTPLNQDFAQRHWHHTYRQRRCGARTVAAAN